jgi:hypothetical protein
MPDEREAAAEGGTDVTAESPSEIWRSLAEVGASSGKVGRGRVG